MTGSKKPDDLSEDMRGALGYSENPRPMGRGATVLVRSCRVGLLAAAVALLFGDDFLADLFPEALPWWHRNVATYAIALIVVNFALVIAVYVHSKRRAGGD